MPNIIVFGEAGAGKSSLVNLITGKTVAETSDGVMGCTFKSTPYVTNLPGGPTIRLWDTAGLNEASTGTATAAKAISNELSDGVNLLVYCVRGRITATTVQNYEMFQSFCEGEVPVALVITHLEHVGDKEKWWSANAAGYSNAGITSCAHACVVTARAAASEEEYTRSASAVQKMIKDHALSAPWKTVQRSWFLSVVKKLVRIMLVGPYASEGGKHLYAGLISNNFSEAEAKKAVKEYERSVGKNGNKLKENELAARWRR
ncbi:hypothetical protein HWV62_37384 [Athelia sp. TMB]|nr:hypothetical protein HWV62_37384 [Athelia sp. TMB]